MVIPLPLGKQIRESSKSTSEADAKSLLKLRQGEAVQGRPVGPQFDRATFVEIAELVFSQYRRNGRGSSKRMEQAFRLHLIPYFGKDYRDRDLKVKDSVTVERIYKYIDQRLQEWPQRRTTDPNAKTKKPTINYELRMLKHALRLGVEANKVALPLPKFKLLDTKDSIRKRFINPEQLEVICKYLSEDDRSVARAFAWSGWRGQDEILTRQWKHVDFKGGWLHPEAGEGKTKEARTIALYPELKQVFVDQARRKLASGIDTQWVFFYTEGKNRGEPIKQWYKRWRAAVEQAAVEVPELKGAWRHDLRRSMIWNMTNAGMNREAQMAFIGHKTEQIYKNYFAALTVDQLKEAGQMLHRSLETRRQAESPFEAPKRGQEGGSDPKTIKETIKVPSLL